MNKLRKVKGFTLVEMMVVIVVVGVLAAVAIPQLLRTKMTGNEAVAQKDLGTIASAMEIYRSSQNPPIYPSALSDLGGGSIPFLDSAIAAGRQHGYLFTLATNAQGATYGCVANPIQIGATGNRSFCMDHQGVLKQYTEEIKSDGTGCPANESLEKAIPASAISAS